MIERVARAIHDRSLDADQLADFGLPMEDAVTMAKAAIEAMREPTEGMIKEGEVQKLTEDSSGSIYMSMIDAALKE